MKPPDREGRVSMHDSEQEHGRVASSQQAGKITALQRQWFELHRPSHGGMSVWLWHDTAGMEVIATRKIRVKQNPAPVFSQKIFLRQNIDTAIISCYTVSRFWKTNRVCKSFSKQFTYGPPDRGGPGYRHLMCRSSGLWPYGQPGPLPIGNLDCLIDWVKSSNFISWFLYNHEIARFGVQTCETVNKE